MIGEGIRIARKRIKMKQSQLALATGLTVTALVQIENERSMPKIANLKKIVQALGITEDELLLLSIKNKKELLTKYLNLIIDKYEFSN